MNNYKIKYNNNKNKLNNKIFSFKINLMNNKN